MNYAHIQIGATDVRALVAFYNGHKLCFVYTTETR